MHYGNFNDLFTSFTSMNITSSDYQTPKTIPDRTRLSSYHVLTLNVMISVVVETQGQAFVKCCDIDNYIIRDHTIAFVSVTDYLKKLDKLERNHGM